VLLWFAGLSLVIVWLVFRSPALDHRMVLAGACAPVVELVLSGPRVLHTLAGAVAALAVVMVATRGRRLVRRRLLGLPIGLFVHLVLDGVWADTELFWWPLLGASFGARVLPELDRGAWVLLMELVGAVALVCVFRWFGLEDPARRATFVRAGRVDRDLTR